MQALVPTGLTASYNTLQNAVQLTWNVADHAFGYNIKRGSTVIASNVQGTTYTDNVGNNSVHTYTIMSVGEVPEANSAYSTGVNGKGWGEFITSEQTINPTLVISHTVQLPSSISSGNLILLMLGLSSGGSLAVGINSPPSGYTLVTNSIGVGSGDARTMYVYAKVSDGNESNPTFTTNIEARDAFLAYDIEGWNRSGILDDIAVGTWNSGGAGGGNTTLVCNALSSPWGSTSNLAIALYTGVAAPSSTPTITFPYPDNQYRFISGGGNSAALGTSSDEITGDALQVNFIRNPNAVWKTVQLLIRRS